MFVELLNFAISMVLTPHNFLISVVYVAWDQSEPNIAFRTCFKDFWIPASYPSVP